MIFYLSTPIFILNIILSSIVTKKLIEARSFSEYKPRFDLLLCLIWSYVPLSFASALIDMLGHNVLHNYKYCAFFCVSKNFAIMSFFAAPALSVFLFILMFTKIKLEKVNYIGNFLFICLVFSVLLRGYIIMGFIGIKKSKFLKTGNPTECTYSNQVFIKFSNYMEYFMQLFVFFFIISVVLYEKYESYTNLKVGERNTKEDNDCSLNLKDSTGRINLMKSFVLIVLLTLILDLLEKISRYFMSDKSLLYAFWNDFRRLKPFFYSLIVILCDKAASIEIKDYPIRRILEIPELRSIFEDYINKSGNKRMKKLVHDIREEILKSSKPNNYISDGITLEEIESNSKLNLEKLEKEAFFEGLSEFYLSDNFIWFLFKFQKTGIIELEIARQRV